jgi:arylsulfatase A-like enzyme
VIPFVMHRFRPLLILFTLLLFSSSQAAPMRPNVLFLITDDQYKTMMNFYPEGKGRNLTPHTDALAAEGTVMRQQYVTSPVCTPSRFGCLTGMYPSRSQSPKFHRSTKEADGQAVVQWNTFLTNETATLPKLFKGAGYFTGMVGKNHVFECDAWAKPDWNADPSDPEAKARLEKNRQVQIEGARNQGFDFAAALSYNNPVENGLKALAAHNLDHLAGAASDFLDQAAAKKAPFFLYLATTVPHGPQAPEQSRNADRRITPDGLLDKPSGVLPAASTYASRLQAAKIKSPQKENILWLDDMVGAVVQKLKETAQLDSTIIVYFNDHGQVAKGTLYQGGIHGECFIWRKGGFPAGNACRLPVSNIDFAPTLLELSGVSFDAAAFDGRSFAKVLLGTETTRSEPLFFELGYARAVVHQNWKYLALHYPKSATEMSLADRKRRLEEFNAEQTRKGRPIHNTDPTQPFSHVSLIPGGGDAEHASLTAYPAFYETEQLYDLTTDANEQTNLAQDPAHAAKLDELKNALKAHLSGLPGTFGILKPNPTQKSN